MHIKISVHLHKRHLTPLKSVSFGQLSSLFSLLCLLTSNLYTFYNLSQVIVDLVLRDVQFDPGALSLLDDDLNLLLNLPLNQNHLECPLDQDIGLYMRVGTVFHESFECFWWNYSKNIISHGYPCTRKYFSMKIYEYLENTLKCVLSIIYQTKTLALS